MNFDNDAPDWSAGGEEPSDELKNMGFTAGYKPPASIFNWFWTKVSNCISELQSKLTSEESARKSADKTLQGNIDAHVEGDSPTDDTTSEATPAHGGTLTMVDGVARDDVGHVLSVNTKTVTIPSAVATTSAAGLMSSTDKTKLDGIDEGANAYTHPTYSTSSSTTSSSPAFGGTFTALSAITTSNGHTTAKTTRTVTIPSNVATTSAKGLMSADDKTKVDALARSVTYVIAASDSVNSASADYTCTGTSDDTVIQTAIDALPTGGGKIVLLEGTYNISAQI